MEADSAGEVPIAGGVAAVEKFFGRFPLLGRPCRGAPIDPEGGGEFCGENFRQPSRDRTGKENATLMKAALFGAALGGAGQLVSF